MGFFSNKLRLVRNKYVFLVFGNIFIMVFDAISIHSLAQDYSQVMVFKAAGLALLSALFISMSIISKGREYLYLGIFFVLPGFLAFLAVNYLAALLTVHLIETFF
ncbi:MAG: hypothetical protein CVU89_03295 [Firmicutes bacterium HGW-Firmicutes-14]|nr:MAG: hypothetical protein CVU89_03295 [Firmicutes bacterium HGW-Firmicutes-14]